MTTLISTVHFTVDIHYCLLTVQHGQGGGGFLCCCAKVTPDAEDRVELAFRRIDLNNDGFITWEEFVQVICQCDK